MAKAFISRIRCKNLNLKSICCALLRNMILLEGGVFFSWLRLDARLFDNKKPSDVCTVLGVWLCACAQPPTTQEYDYLGDTVLLIASTKDYDAITFCTMVQVEYLSRLVFRQGHVHDDVIKWKHFSRYWPFVRGIHRSPVNSTHKGQWRGALMFTLISARINGWVNKREAGDLGHNRAHYDVIVMLLMRTTFQGDIN